LPVIVPSPASTPEILAPSYPDSPVLRQYSIVADARLRGKSVRPWGTSGLFSQLISAVEMVFAVIGAMGGVTRCERLRGEKKHSKHGRNHHAFHRILLLVSMT
jgi:hypothetical protein